jgi:hypothetical protein
MDAKFFILLKCSCAYNYVFTFAYEIELPLSDLKQHIQSDISKQ